jgi:hypothetical protein
MSGKVGREGGKEGGRGECGVEETMQGGEEDE